MRKLSTVMLLGVIVFLLCSCLNQSTDAEKGILTKGVVYPEGSAFDDFEARQKLVEENPVKDRFVKSVNTFSYDTMQVLFKNQTENFNYSPLSRYYALALAGTGADGETQEQMLDLMGVSSAKELSVQCGNLYRILYTDNEISKLKIANSLWLDDDAAIKDEFVSNAAEDFYASVFPVDFADGNAGTLMSKWISENTNGTIQPNLETKTDQILSIINTIYFCDEWTSRFDKDKTQDDLFHAVGNDVTVAFMNQTFGSSGFAKGENFTRSSLNLKGNGQMVFILPNEGVSVSQLISHSDSMETLFEEGESYSGEVVWKIPKFRFDTEMDVIDSLEALGITKAFDSDADFSNITDGMACISSIIQQTHIAIDENGVEASAFTQIDYYGAMLPKDRAEMILDRPFLYGITAPNGTLLFVGVCNDPSL